MSTDLSHIDKEGNTVMVDVGMKSVSERTAVASGKVLFPESVYSQLSEQGFVHKKGGIIQTAIIAGIQAVKRTSDLIPLCHQLMLSKVDIDIQPFEDALHIKCMVKCTGKTGVEMEALTGVSVSALTIYDMCKALSHDILITDIKLEMKTGGKHEFSR
ncbi:cyclic pyranopterin monophosphate synthase MoaC [Robertkochia solimangrovi]|uniref:cyclic pyranopterin monophosphate synthase MoaC n=1 Tax=Robertkochia solimangrovi TaxID=2213046 RepID=UPI0011805FFF|nr:cyclic pyranopterin monophosphate synthase MoaC [Robertkochia solimangrovi]TRZ43272.1 cyclic pyranopterin monophosphate synthase MoaC [Robertkochia solimangrovi]